MASSNCPPAKEPPPLDIPASSNTVDISVIDTTSRIQNLPASIFLEPKYKSLTNLDCPAFSFLITHAPTGKKYLFNLGIRKDWETLSKPMVKRVTDGGWRLTIAQNVAEILHDAGVPPASIDGIIWSHHHWDHTGNPATFPASTSLIVGPGFKSAFTPGYPRDQNSPILESDYAGRELREVDFGGGLRIGGFRAVDFFHDGSFYLLDCPGHAVGHMCGLARTTTTTTSTNASASVAGGQGEKAEIEAGADTFMLLGGDVAHHAGEIRPTPYLPLPPALSPSPLPAGGTSITVCPGDAMACHHRLYPDSAAWTQPFILPSGNAAHDLPQALASVEGVGGLVAHPEVFTCLALDKSLVGVVGFFPLERANRWREKGWRTRSLWSWVWLGDYVGGVVVEGG